MLTKAAGKAGNAVAKLASLSPEQLLKVQEKRDQYLSEMPNPTDSTAEELTKRLLAASGVEIFNAYLPQLSQLYLPISKDAEYGAPFRSEYNIRYINITKWVTDKNENSLEKLVNVYEVLSNEDCNIALIFRRKHDKTEVYLAVTNTKNDNNSVDVNNYQERITDAIRGNFPGSRLGDESKGILPCFDTRTPYSIASASNIPTEKSEQFISQTIEKLLDGTVPDSAGKEYTIILLATPILDVEERKLRLSEIYSGLAPYSSWQTNFTYTESDSTNSSATVGVNVGASAGSQNGQNQSSTVSDGTTDSVNTGVTDTTGQSVTDSTGTSETSTSGSSATQSYGTTMSEGTSVTEGINESSSEAFNGGISLGISGGYTNTGTHGTSFSEAITESVAKSTTNSVANSLSQSLGTTASRAIGSTIGRAISNTLGRAVTQSVAKTAGTYGGTNFGVNFGANFARSSSVTATIGKNEGITQSYTNYTIKHALELLENQMKRFEQSTALGMWDFAAYVLSEDQNVANNVAHSYIALTQGEESYMSKAAINLWRGDMANNSGAAKEIYQYLRELRHPIFGINPDVVDSDATFNVYPSIVTATTALTGKELAYSLNFPQKSIAGLPVLTCAEFGRNIVTHETENKKDTRLRLGYIFHMNHQERTRVRLSKQSLASHTFITGSTGSGKSNTVYQILSEAENSGTNFLVIEPAKGEYKTVFGMNKNVSVYGTNPEISPLLKINPFSFPKGIHVLEHLDRLIEIFNVCWPMYAAMPAILKSAVEKSYADCGWLLNKSKNIYNEELFPTFADVARNVKAIIESSEYDNENKGAYKGALLTRLQSLTNGINGMIFVQDEIDAKVLFDSNVIADLSRVGSSETKSLIMGMLVLKLQEHRMTTTDSLNSPLNHITVLEEAHNLLKRTSMSGSESADLAGKSVEMLANAIAEMRTYGEGFIIVDQSPGLLDMSTIRNTNTKIIMRLPDLSDRELVGKSAGLNDDQIIEIAKFPCGVAAVYQNEWIQPVLCKVEKYSVSEQPYKYNIDDNQDVYGEQITKLASESLLDFIMSKEPFIKDKFGNDNSEPLKSMIIKSKLDSDIKCDFIEYINSQKNYGIDELRKLIYDFLSASEAIDLSKEQNNIKDWVHSVVSKLTPTIQEYSKRQIDLVVAMILLEQTERDKSYNDILCRFAEVYKSEGGVF